VALVLQRDRRRLLPALVLARVRRSRSQALVLQRARRKLLALVTPRTMRRRWELANLASVVDDDILTENPRDLY